MQSFLLSQAVRYTSSRFDEAFVEFRETSRQYHITKRLLQDSIEQSKQFNAAAFKFLLQAHCLPTIPKSILNTKFRSMGSKAHHLNDTTDKIQAPIIEIDRLTLKEKFV